MQQPDTEGVQWTAWSARPRVNLRELLFGRQSSSVVAAVIIVISILAVDVRPAAAAPIAVAGGPYAIAEGENLSLNGSGSTGSTSYAWDLDSDGQFDDATGATPSVSWAALQGLGLGDDGSYDIGLRTSDGVGTDDDVVLGGLVIANSAPTISTAGDSTVPAGTVYGLDLSATDPGADAITSWRVIWGDGSVDTYPGATASASHTYMASGLHHEIVVSATDEDGTWSDAELIATGFQSNAVHRYDHVGSYIETLGPTDRPFAVVTGPDGLLYVTSNSTNTVDRYDPADGSFFDTFVSAGSGGLDEPTGLIFGRDGNLLVGSFRTDQVLEFDAATGAPLGVFASGGGLDGIGGLAFGADGRLYVAGVNSDAVHRYDGLTGAYVSTFVPTGSGLLDGPEALLFTASGHLLVASKNNDRVMQYDATTGALASTLVTDASGGLGAPVGLAIEPGGQLLVASSQTNQVLKYDVLTGAPLGEFVPTSSGLIDRPYALSFASTAEVSVVNAPLTVNSTGDLSDASAGNGSCDTGNTNSQGVTECTLRAAIQEANGLAGFDTIQFDIPQTETGYVATPESFRIRPSSLLPAISTPMSIDGSSQSEFAPNGRPVIELDGQSVSAGEENGLWITGGGTTIRGLVINDWGDDAIDLEFVGGNTIVGNYIGTDVTGTTALPNAWGINMKTADNIVGGASPTDRNVVSGNTNHGVYIKTATAIGNVVQGNYIGTNSAGDGAVPNSLHGVTVEGAPGTEILDNLISGNNGHGVYLTGLDTTGTYVLRNTIGANEATTARLDNVSDGIRLEGDSSGSVIGGIGDGNVISGNTQHGVNAKSSSNNTIQANWIGTNATGSLDLGNGMSGFSSDALGSSSNLIGGSVPGEGNTIAFNGEGVTLPSGVDNSILGNDVYSNDTLGIDLVGGTEDGFGVTSNGTATVNDGMSHPSPTAASELAGTVTVDFDLNVPAGDYRIDVFTNPSGVDPSGHGEGESFEDGTTITHTGGGLQVFQISYSGGAGDLVTLTATEEAAGPIYGSTSEFSAAVTATGPAPSISGSVFEDIAGDLLTDGSIGGASNPGTQNVDVYLYLDDGDSNLDAGDTLVGGAPTQTDISGAYAFTGLANGDYFVVVDSKSVSPAQDPAAIQTEIWAEQTYGPVGGYCDNGTSYTVRLSAGNCYGGITGDLSDNFSQWDDREHRSFLTVSGTDVTAVDFGFSFNVVTNTAGGGAIDHDTGSNRTVQGSLRQFIQNANAIDGTNTMRFVPAESVGATDGFGNSWWRIVVTSILPAVTGDGTTIDGRAFDFTDGVTVLDPNAAQIGAGQAVGTAGTYTTPLLDPELEIWNNRAVVVVPTGLVFEASDATIRHVSIWGFGSTGSLDTNVKFGTNFSTTPNFTGSLVEFNVIGTQPASFVDPGAGARSGQKNLAMREADYAIVRDNLIGFAGGVGVDFSGTTGGTVLRNEVRRNGLLDSTANPVGMWIGGSITGNLVTDNAAGIFNAPTGGIRYEDNTITANGWGGTRPHGIWVFGASTTIRRNIIANNIGSGVVVQSNRTNAYITRNSFYGNGTTNGQIGIDLLASGDDSTAAPFLTPNDSGDADVGGNNLINFPVLDTADVIGSDLIITGWARPGATIELYLADPDPSGFGQGKTWLITLSEGSASDADATTSTYGPAFVNGLDQGTDTTNRFSFTLSTASLDAPLTDGDSLTSVARWGASTSEFSGNVVLPVGSAISGLVFEDIAGDLLTDGAIGGATNPGSVGVDVHLYDGTDSLIATDTTDDAGGYFFTGLPDDTYTIWVDSTTVSPAQDPTAVQSDIWAEQTYGPLGGSCATGTGTASPNSAAGSCFGGSTGLLSDNSTVRLHRAQIPLSGIDVAAVDFGFSFNVVTNTRGGDGTDDDPGANRTVQGSLRQFIQNANAIAGANVMRFVPVEPIDSSAGVDEWWRVGVTNSLDSLSSTDTTIDGTAFDLDDGVTVVDTNSVGPELELDGSAATVAMNGLTITSAEITLRDMTISGFSGSFSAGVLLYGSGADFNVLSGLYLGTNASATAVNPNYWGVRLGGGASGNIIGGTTLAARNVISGNSEGGISITGPTTELNIISGNYIGTNAAGNAPVPNQHGVSVGGGALNTTIGGATVAHRNVISGNTYQGVSVTTDFTNIWGNYIGTNAAGTAAVGNARGVWISAGDNNLVGGGDPLSGNLISGNTFRGVIINNAATNNTVSGNLIGTDALSTGSIPNSGPGVLIGTNTTNNLIGGEAAGAGNVIANNTGAGVELGDLASTGNAILANAIYSNGKIGIDLVGGTENGFGVTTNGTGLVNHPIITSATVSGSTVTIGGTFDVPAGDYRFNFFANPSGGDPSGHGEGEVLVETSTLSHIGSGPQAFDGVFAGSVGDLISVTITEESTGPVFGSTSEFSASITAVASGDRAIDSSNRRSDATALGGFDLTPGTAGIAGDGFVVDGPGQRLVGPATDLTSSALTISGWVRLDSAGSDPRLVAKGVGAGAVYELLIDDATGEAVARIDVSGSLVEVRGGTVPIGSWHHLAATWNGSTLTLHVNGFVVDTAVAAGTLTVDLNASLVVGNNAIGTAGVNGMIDQIELSHRATPAAEIAARFRNVSSPAAYLSIGAAQSAAPTSWTTAAVQTRTGAGAAAAPITPAGVDAWLTAVGVDEPGVEFASWWWVSDPATSEVAAGTRTGAVATDQFDLAATSSGLDLGVFDAGSRTSSATSPTVLASGSWQRIVVLTDELGVTSVWVDGVQEIGPTALSGLVSGSVGFRATSMDGAERWFVDDVRARRLVSDEPIASLGVLERN